MAAVCAAAAAAAGAAAPSPDMVCVAIIFNLALAYQLWAVEEESSLDVAPRQSLLRKAIKIYSISQDMLRMAKIEDTDLFVLAMINNQGQARQALGESDIAQVYFQYLLSLLQRVVSCGDAGRSRLSDHLEFFFGSTVHFMLLGNITAAAA